MITSKPAQIKRTLPRVVGNLRSLLFRHRGLVLWLIVVAALVASLVNYGITLAGTTTATMLPDSDVTTGWSPSAGTTHYNLVDDGTTDDPLDYVQVLSTNVSAGVSDQYTLNSPMSVDNASQVVLRIYMQATTNANGGTMDTISLNLIVNGTAQTATTCTPVYNSWTACTATYNGSWTQADVDSMQISITRNTLGGGKPSSIPDTLQVANVYGTLTYTLSATMTQSAYRFFTNRDSAPSELTFAKNYGGPVADNGESIISTSDGGYAVSGYTSSFGAGGYDFFLSKFDSQGDLSWSKTVGGGSNDVTQATPRGLVQTTSGDYVLIGYTQSFGAGGQDVFIAKFSSNGNVLWTKTWGSAGGEEAKGIASTSDGGFVVTGATNGFSNLDSFIAKYDSAGNLSWSRTWGGSGSEYGLGIIQTSDGGYAETGYTASYAVGSNDIYLAKYNSAGNLSWSRTWGGAGDDAPVDLIQSSDGNYVIAGYTVSFGVGGSKDSVLLEFNSAGNLNWSRTWGGTGSDQARALLESGGSYYVGGMSNSFGSGDFDGILLKYNASGVLLWSRTFGTASVEQTSSLTATANGGLAATVVNNEFDGGTTGFELVKYDSTGNITNCSTRCHYGTAGGGSDYTGTVRSDTIGGGSDYTSTVKTDTIGGGSNYTSTNLSDTVGGGSNYTSITKTDTVGGGSNYTSSSKQAPFAITPFIQVSINYATYSVGQTGPGGGTIFYQSGNTYYEAASSGWGGVSDPMAGWGCSGTLVGSSGTILGTGGHNISNILKSCSDSDTAAKLAYNYKGGGYSDWILPSKDELNQLYLQRATVQGFAAGSYWTSSESTSTDAWGQNFSDGSQASSSKSNKLYVRPIRIFTAGVVVGDPLSPQDSSLASPLEGSPYRLRIDLHVDNGSVDASEAKLKLQYAPKGGSASCSVVGDSSFDDVTDDTPISYYKNVDLLSGLTIANDANDPVHNPGAPDANIQETYQGGDTTAFSNSSAIAPGEDGTWDFALTTKHALQNSTYCIRVVYSNDAPLSLYSVFPEITTPAASLSVGSYRWLDGDSPSLVTFAKIYGGAQADSSLDVIQTSDGGYAVTGQETSYTAGLSDVFISKYDASGALSWTSRWGGANNDIGVQLVQTTDGGYAVVGQALSYQSSGDAFILKYSPSGALLWNTTWGGSGAEFGWSIANTSDGGLAISGEEATSSAGGLDVFLTKYNSDGALQWTEVWGGTSDERGASVIQTSDGGFAVTGFTSSFGTGTDLFVAKYDSLGVLKWLKTWGGSQGDYAKQIVQTSDGGFAIAGYTQNYGAGGWDSLVIKFDSAGSVQWDRTWGGLGDEYGQSITPASGGGVAVTGYTNSFGAGGIDAFLIRYSSSGDLEWSKTIGGSGTDQGVSVTQTSDGGFMVTGPYGSPGAAGTDVLLAKFDANGEIKGCLTTMCQTPGAFQSTPGVSSVTRSVTPTNPSLTSGNPSATNASVSYSTVVLVTVSAPVVLGGTPLAGSGIPIDETTIRPLNLRLSVRVDGSGVDASNAALKLVYALRGSSATCSAVGTNNYSDVTASSPIAYYDDPKYSDGLIILKSTYDPVDSGRENVLQSFQESNSFTNIAQPIYAGQNGLWQFSLKINNSTLRGKDFCLRVATSAGALITANNIADIAFAPHMTQIMGGGDWWSRIGDRQSKAL